MAVSLKKREAYSRWHNRRENAKRVSDGQYNEIWKRLEDSLAGEFPILMDTIKQLPPTSPATLLTQCVRAVSFLHKCCAFRPFTYHSTFHDVIPALPLGFRSTSH